MLTLLMIMTTTIAIFKRRKKEKALKENKPEKTDLTKT